MENEDKNHHVVDEKPDDEGNGESSSLDEQEKTKTEEEAVEAAEVLPSKPPPSMDVTVHRLRHLQFHPKPILALQATSTGSSSTTTSTQRGYLALSRENGLLELKDVDKLRTVATIAGYRQKPVHALAWLCSAAGSTTTTSRGVTAESSSHGNDQTPKNSNNKKNKSNNRYSSLSLPPLMGAARDGTVFCLDFKRQSLTHIMPSGGGAVFALTTKCRRCPCNSITSSTTGTTTNRPSSSCCRLVAGGCQDGATRIWRLNIEDDDDRAITASPSSSSTTKTGLLLVSTVPSAGAPVLSLAWQPNQSSGSSSSGSILYAAVADGTIRRYDDESGSLTHWTSTLRLTMESLGRTTPTRVWALEALRDGTLVSADSLGHVQFWDGPTGTLQQSIDQNDNKADVLCLAVSEDESKVYASGVDSRVVCMERVSLQKLQSVEAYYGPVRRWTLSHAQRPHTHDVNALAIVQQAVKKNLAPSEKRYSYETQEILCSGGLDTKLCTYSVDNGRKKRPRTLYPWPANLISLARKLRVFVMLREERIDVYQLGPKQAMDESFPVRIPSEKTLLGTVQIEGASNLVCAAISDDGRYLALSDAYAISVFHLDFNYDSDILVSMREPKKVTIENSLPFAASAVCFLNTQRDLICSCLDGKIRVLNIVENSSETEPFARVLQVIDPGPPGAAEFEGAAQSIVVAQGGDYFATMHSIPSGGRIDVFRAALDCESNKKVDTKKYRHWWTLPAMELAPCVMSFLVTSKPELAVACLNFGVYIFDVAKRRLSPWSEAMGYPVHKALPPEFLHRNDYPVHITVNIGSPHKFLVGSCGAFVVFDLTKDFPKTCSVFPERHVRGGKKRKRSWSIVSEGGGDEEEAGGGSEKEQSSCTMCLRYNSMLCLDSVDANELMIVEQPWLSVVATFPEALQRKVYAT